MKHIRMALLALSLTVAVLGSVLVFVPGQGALAKTPQQAACEAINGAACTEKNSDLSKIIAVIVNTISLVVGMLAIIMIVIAGAKYVISGGDAQKVTSAKNALIAALIGLIIVALAQFMVRVVLNKAETVTKPASLSSTYA